MAEIKIIPELSQNSPNIETPVFCRLNYLFEEGASPWQLIVCLIFLTIWVAVFIAIGAIYFLRKKIGNWIELKTYNGQPNNRSDPLLK